MLLLFKLGFEFLQSRPEPGLDGAQRHPGDLSNLPQGQLLTEPEQQHLLLFRGQGKQLFYLR